MTRHRSSTGWSTALVIGGSLGSALFFGGAVAILVWFGDPLRFAGIDSALTILRGAIALGWLGAWLAIRWWLRRRSAGEKASPLELLAVLLAPLGGVAFFVPLPQSPWMIALSVGVVAGLAALVPLMGFVERRVLLAQIGSVETVEKLMANRSPQLRAARGVLFVLGLALCVLSASRPQLHQGTRMLSRRGIDIVVALDFSKSMLARDVAPSRIDLAKRELDQLIESLGGDRVGLVAFAGEAIQFPLTTDYEAATLFWRDLDPNDMPVGGTAIGRALNAAVRLFENDRLSAQRSKVIVLLTDGEDHEGDPIEVARQAAQNDIHIHVLGIGGETPELIPQIGADGAWSGFQRDRDGEYVSTALTAENERQLQQIAEVSGGRYFRAAPGQVGVDHIRREIRRLRQDQLDERRVRLYGEAYQSFLLFGLLALIVGATLPRGRPSWGGTGSRSGS